MGRLLADISGWRSLERLQSVSLVWVHRQRDLQYLERRSSFASQRKAGRLVTPSGASVSCADSLANYSIGLRTVARFD